MSRYSVCRLGARVPPALHFKAAQVGYGRWFSFARPVAAFSFRSHSAAPSIAAHHRTTSILTSTSSSAPQPRNCPRAWNRTRAFATMHKAPAAKITGGDPDVTINTPRDPNTLSNYHNFLTKHTVANFEIDFEKKVLHGGVELTFESLTEGETKDIVLDTRYGVPFAPCIK